MESVAAFAAVAFGVVLAFAGAELCARALKSVGRGVFAGLGALAGAVAASAPEFLFATRAQWDGAPDLALGLVAGSLIANALLAAPLAAAGAQAPAGRAAKLLGLWTALGVAALIACAWDGAVYRVEGFMLLAGSLIAAVIVAVGERREGEGPRQPLWMSAAGLLAGVVLLLFGSVLAVDAALNPALSGLDGPLATGLVVFGLAAALPEIAAAGMAVRLGEGRDALANVVAGTAITAFGAIGAASMLAAVPVEPGFLRGPAALMVFAAVLLSLSTLIGGRLPRWAPVVGALTYAGVILFVLHAA